MIKWDYSGSRLTERRYEARLTQEDLAELVGVSKQTVGFWEQGRRYPTLTHVAKLQVRQFSPRNCISLRDLTTISDHFVLVLDDYHVIDAKPIDHALTFLLEYLPPQMHLVIATREDPQLSLARLRARGQLTELRATDLRFTPSEAAGFLNQGMGLNLSAEDIAALETRTEGWIAGLQLAALSLQGHQDTSSFITSFTGSHHFVLDYLG